MVVVAPVGTVVVVLGTVVVVGTDVVEDVEDVEDVLLDEVELPGAVVVVGEDVLVEVLEPVGTIDIVVDVTVEVVVVLGSLGCSTPPNRPESPVDRFCCWKGSSGWPGWAAPIASTTTKMPASAPVAIEPTYTRRMARARRSLRSSELRRRSSSGVSCVRWFMIESSGDDA